jgi:uncharacterized membrane protein
MKSTFFVALSIYIISFFAPLYAEEIKNFYMEMLMSEDGSISVQEDIEYDFGNEYKHGIIREIPYKYQIGIKNYNLRMHVHRATNFDGVPYKSKVSRDQGRLIVKVGDPDKVVNGVKNYRIDYIVDGAITFFNNHDEIYWNVTGNEWKVPMRRASARVYFDKGVPKGATAKCHTGVYGSKAEECDFNMTPTSIEFDALRGFGEGEGLSIVIGIPKGFFKEPSTLRKASWFISDNWFFALPFLTLFLISYVWYSRGRDPEGRSVVAVRYEPPVDITPAEAGTLMDESADILDVTSTVIDLAVRGFLKIEEIESTRFIFFSDRDYKLIKLKDPGENELKTHESEVFSGLFGAGKGMVMISELKDNFYKVLPPIKKALYQELISSRYFSSNPENIRGIFKWIGIGIIVVSMFLFQFWGVKLSIVLSGLFVLIFSRFMPRKTKKGSLAKEELLGFREFIERAEKDRIEKLAKDDPTLFDRVLPYALVFNLGDRWADAFKDIYTSPPSWYYSPRYGDAFAPRIFLADLGRSLSVMNSSFASSPKKSGGSGFGGGGFSGGGFGGGGGRSW